MITKENTQALKGIAILLVLFGHCLPPFLPFAEIYVPIKRMISQLGVEIFMAISGYGIAVAYLQRSSDPIRFLLRRFVQIWPVYFFAMTFYLFASILLFDERINFQAIMAHIFWVQVFFQCHREIYSASHFFSALLVVYVLSAIAMRFQKNGLSAIAFAVGLVGFQVFSYRTYNIFLFADYLASFFFGVMVGHASTRSRIIPHLSLLLLSYFFCIFELYALAKALLGAVVFIASAMILRRGDSWLGPKLVFLGLNSYVIYLGHNYFLWKWPRVLETTGSYAWSGVIIILATMLWMAVLWIADKALNQRVVNPFLIRLG
jgi:peptidoglycan/LPS O-acetylase OafA/YrhL